MARIAIYVADDLLKSVDEFRLNSLPSISRSKFVSHVLVEYLLRAKREREEREFWKKTETDEEFDQWVVNAQLIAIKEGLMDELPWDVEG